jgi:replicative DNA helicase
MLSDLRESGSIEQDADIVLFINRPEYYGIPELEDGRSSAGIAELVFAKGRNIGMGQTEVGFTGSTTKFFDLEENKLVPF